MIKRLFPLLLILILLAGCKAPALTSTPAPAPTHEPASAPTPTPALASAPAATPAHERVQHLVISEVLAGKKGNNNYEFIELYNPTGQPLDLQGLTLWYQLNDKQKPVSVAHWGKQTLVPSQGHYLLVREGQDVGVTPDATFSQAINLGYGSLALRQGNKKLIDALGWGKKAPANATEGTAAPGMKNGDSLTRLPGGDEGNGQDSDDNSADFASLTKPQPQNSASAPTPAITKYLSIVARAPESVKPGETFEYEITVGNHTGEEVQDVVAKLTLASQLILHDLPQAIRQDDHTLTWHIDQLADGDEVSIILPVETPWTYFDATLQSYTVQAKNWPQTAIGPGIVTRIEGGVIPIATARTLQGAQLTLEGTAIMYTGGYYAGGGNVKFYLRDDTGGIQVQVFGGEGSVSVNIGDQVRVKGTIGAYRGANQIVPDIVPDDVTILKKGDAAHLPKPTVVTIEDALNDEALRGQLVQIEGEVTAVEEYTYSYSIDMADAQGHSINFYVDKGTKINPEAIEKGQLYRARGILEVRDGKVQLYPRVQSDLGQVFPPELMVTAEAPLTVQTGELITYTGSIFNHTAEGMTEIVVTAPVPKKAKVAAISEGGELKKGKITWRLADLAADSGRADVWFSVIAPKAANGRISFKGFSAISKQWPDLAKSGQLNAFLGEIVPIWAIQGPDDRSPYALKWLSTEGEVTGVFPDLPGFFIQNTEPDKRKETSEGLFVNTAELDAFPEVAIGQVVRLYGQVKETSQQTQLLLTDPNDVQVVDETTHLPKAIKLNPPKAEAKAAVYYEALEGMLVSAPGPNRAVSPTSKYGEYVIVPPGHKEVRLWRGQEHGFAIMVDDGSSAKHESSETLPYTVTTGDIIKNIEGPLAFSYGHYKIEPVQAPTVIAAEHPLPELPLVPDDAFALATWNAENVFDAIMPNPKDPPLPTPKQYHLALEKMAATIAQAGFPTVIGMEEIENIDVLTELAAQEAIQGQKYQPVLMEGEDGRGIDVGYLVRGNAKILDVKQYSAPEGLTSRPPLVLKLEVILGDAPQVIYVILNHFTSMSAGVEITEPRRLAQAEWNVHIIKEIIQKQEPEAMIAVMGDLNAFFDSKPVQALREAGLKHVLDAIPAKERYTYIFQGDSQVLDHILVTPNLYEHLQDVVILHVNADFPPATPGDTSPIRKSDHDPIIALFR